MKNLYIDFDGVILNTIPPLYEALEKAGIEPGTDEASEFFSKFDFKAILKDENIINDSINALRELNNCGKFNVSILTHITSLEEGIEKTKYIRKHIRDITVILVPKSISKTQMVHTKDAILVDDFPLNLEEWESKGGIGVKFTENLDKNDFIRINDLRSLINIFE